MPNGRPGDHPLTDLLKYGEHPFPPDIEEMIRRVQALDPSLLARLRSEPFEWAGGRSLEEARALLNGLLQEAKQRRAAAAGAADRPTYRLDGAAFSDLEGFYDEVGIQLLGGIDWGRNLDALNDVLRGELGGLPPEFTVVWEHSDLSRTRLGETGHGCFPDLLEIFAAHPNVELVLS